MITNDLLVVTMGIAFYFIPLLLLIATGLFLWRRREALRAGTDSEPEKGSLMSVIKDPVTVVTVLAVGGFVMVAFMTGRFSFGDYFSIPGGALEVLWESVTEWEDPLSADSIALRGGVLIAVVSAAVVTLTSLSYFRARLGDVKEDKGGAARGSH